MGDDTVYHPSAKATSTVTFQNVNIRKVTKGCIISDHSGKTYLFRALIDTETERVGKRCAQHLPAPILAPISLRQEGMDSLKIQSRRIGAEREFAVLDLKAHHSFLVVRYAGTAKTGRRCTAASKPPMAC